jgi:drug/metabolite transporter (DMT)-like permease
MLFWAGNSIAGRALADDAAPLGLAFWRWVLALVLLTPVAWPHLKVDAPELRRRWRMILALAFTGVGTFGALLYVGLQYTSALNSILMQAAIPPLVMLFAWVALRERTSRGQLAGVVLSLLGVLVVISRGRPWSLLDLDLNGGDALVFAGVVLYAVYSLLLRRRPDVHPLSLLWATFSAAALMLAPAYALEHAFGRTTNLTAEVLLGAGYVAVFPSFLAYLFFNRGVALIGSARASQFLHLQPVFGAVLAVLLLGEQVHLFHAAGVALIFSGIALGAWTQRRVSRRAPESP